MSINHSNYASLFFNKSFKVYFGDTDAAGVVYHGKYIYWLEAARIDFFDFLGCPYQEFQQEKIGFVPVDISIQYKKPLVFADEFDIRISISKLTKATVSVKGDVYKSNILHCSSIVKLTCLDEKTWKVLPLHERFLKALDQKAAS
ncbi:hypothetical protein DID78_02940 [Candidatus Marinamargulisbacteria bacterium SCGC AG-343-D04]|nr:hypothetical protein DID78_02940 [Candidatus Marinamargulisbacteria bacterium SCGC AG-343-D04]